MTDPINETLAAWSTWVWKGNLGHSLGAKISSAYSLVPPGGYGDDRMPETSPDVLKFDRIYRARPCLLQEPHRIILGLHYLGPGRVPAKATLLSLTVRQYHDRLAAAKSQAAHLLAVVEKSA